jgi:hypothetical protein
VDATTTSHEDLPEWFAAQPWETPGLPWDLHHRERTDDDAATEDAYVSRASPSAA